jgi:hypothetical protein
MIKKLNHALVLISVLSATSACTRGGGPGAAFGPININLSDVSTGECLNLGSIAERMSRFSPNVSARLYTTRVSMESGDERARPQFPSLIARSCFVLQDQPFSELNPFQSVNQAGCEQATITDRFGVSETYKVKEAGADFVHFELNENKSVRFQLLTPQSISITMRYTATDVCHWQTQARVEHTRILRWGGAEVYQSEETITTDLLHRVSQTLAAVPPEIEYLLQSAQGEAIEIRVDDLRQLLSEPVKAEVLTCPGHVANPDTAPTPNPNEEREAMSGNTTPTPTPTPVR